MRRTLPLLALVAAACTSPTSGAGGAAGSGGASDGGCGGNTGSGGALGSGGTGGSGGGAGVAGGLPAGCAGVPDGVSLRLTLADGTTDPQGASGWPLPDYLLASVKDVVGKVVPSEPGVWLTLDTCPPRAGCAPSPVKLEVEGTHLAHPVPEGSFARIRFESCNYMGWYPCAVLVTEASSFGGVSHADAKGRTWLLAASDAYKAFQAEFAPALADVPFTLDMRPIEGCPPPQGNHCPCEAQYSAWAFHFADRADASNDRVAIMGQLVEGWAVGGQRFDLYAANASYHCGCDEVPWWSFWATQSK